MDQSLRDLNTAIQARIAKEDAFIARITSEFDRIRTQMQQAASANPDAEAILAPFIQRIAPATAQLNNQSSFGTGSNSDQNELFNRVVNSRSSRPASGSGSGATPAVTPAVASGGLFSSFFSPSPAPRPSPTPRPSRGFRPTAEQRDAYALAQNDIYEDVQDAHDDTPEPTPPEPTESPRLNRRSGFGGSRKGGWKSRKSKRPRRTRRTNL